MDLFRKKLHQKQRSKVLNKAKLLYIITILVTSMLITAPISIADPGDFIGTLDWMYLELTASLNDLVRINDTGVFAAFYQGSATDGYIETFRANTTGDLNFTTVVDKYEFGTTIDGISPGVCHIKDTAQYLVGYSTAAGGAVGSSKFSIVRIFEDGTIQKHITSNATIVNVSAYYFNVTHFSGPFYVAVSQQYVGGIDTIYIHTIHYNTSDATIFVNDTQALPVADGKFPRVQVIDNNRIVIAYLNGGNEAVNVTTWYINPSNGDISGLMTDGQNHNALGDKGKAFIKRVGSGTVYLVSYTYDAGGYIPGVGIVEIDTNGIITSADTYSSTHVFNRGYGDVSIYPAIFPVQESTLYGINTDRYVFFCNVTGATVALHGDNNGYETSTTPGSNPQASPVTLPFEHSAFVFLHAHPTDSKLYAVSFRVENNWAAPELTP